MPRIQGRIDPDGAVIIVTVMIGKNFESQLQARGMPVPPPFTTTALIDTGASRTAIHPMIAQSLSLPSVGFASVAAPGQSVITSASAHAVRIALDQPASAWFAADAVAVAPGTPSVLVIIGRDVLMQCRLLFDGPGKAFRLRF